MNTSFLIFEHFPPPSLFEDIHKNTNGFVFSAEIEADTKAEALQAYLAMHQEKYRISHTRPADSECQEEGWYANITGNFIADSHADIILLHDCEVLAVDKEHAYDNEGMLNAYAQRQAIYA